MGGVLGGIGKILGGPAKSINEGSGSNVSSFAVLPPHLEEQYDWTIGGMRDTQSKEWEFAKMLEAQSKGEGPNPAALMLQQETNKNNQNAAAMLASQRGINPGLAARLASEQAVGANQQAAGQAGVMRANQILSSQQLLGNVYGNLAENRQREFENMNNTYMAAQGMNMNAYINNANNNQKTMGGIMSGIGGAMGTGGTSGGAPATKAHGGVIEGKAKVAGDSLENDTVPTMLSPGEIVVPRSVAGDEDKAKEFVESIIKQKKGKANGEEHGYSKVLRAKESLKEALKHLDAHGKKGK